MQVTKIIILAFWMLLTTEIDGRHIQVATQRNTPATRQRLLVIRPPEGSGQPNRIVVISSPRQQSKKSSSKSPGSSKGGIPKTSSGGITDKKETIPVVTLPSNPGRSFGGHPQSAARKQVAAKSSTQSNRGGTRSLRQIIEGIRNRGQQVSTRGSNTNIFPRVSETAPRAAPPVPPTEKRFGELNIPRVIEAALRKLQNRAQERARVMGNVRDPAATHSQSPGSWDKPPKREVGRQKSPFSGGVIDLSKVSIDRNNRVVSGVDGGKRDPNNSQWATSRVPPQFGRNGITPPDIWDPSTSSQGGSGRGNPFIKNNDLLRMKSNFRFDASKSPTRRTGSNLRTVEDKTLHVALQSPPTTPVSVEMQNLFNRYNIGSLDALAAQLDAFNTKHNTTTAAGSKVKLAKPPTVTKDVSKSIQTPKLETPKIKTPVATLNQTATVSAASANTNTTTNTTSKKSVKTKTIKVTTVVKGGTSADVAAAAASQAEIANAVAQGKDINSTSLAGIAAQATSKVASTVAKNQLPAGSITVKRQKNGESIITLSDGQGEPVVLRTSGPVKIERIVKPNGKVQFLINPVKPVQLTNPFELMSTMDPADLADLDVPEELFSTTVATATSRLLTFASRGLTTHKPLLVPKLANAVVNGALKSAMKDIAGLERNKVVDAAIDRALIATFSSLPFETTTSQDILSTINTSNGMNTVNNNKNTNNNIVPTDASMNSNGILNMEANLNNDLMRLFPLPTIPRPPRVLGSMFDSNNGFRNNLHLQQLPTSQISLDTTTLSSKNILKNTTLPPKPKATQKPDVMPKYDLINSSPSSEFTGNGNHNSHGSHRGHG